MGIQLFETSAKDNINVEEMFLAITQKVLRHKKQMQNQNDSQHEGIKLDRRGPDKQRKNKKCC